MSRINDEEKARYKMGLGPRFSWHFFSAIAVCMSVKEGTTGRPQAYNAEQDRLGAAVKPSVE
ncbi:hypothetical protein BBD42_11105 [Paenibacillus sp. BIHB 4019]|uniref:Uncharacterized protein n=1 Tax=Paenibacillus sp. BIHB 4019 TaxID=1870819 RepID=A0A1B2DGU9_9BACL|nr:hypothetical protein BBD42_11105 [Paenibacillus sp. BIHB 4019]